jgi:hypothetical protein
MITQRQRLSCAHCGADQGYPKDPPLTMPEGYSMMADLERERSRPPTRYHQPPAAGSYGAKVIPANTIPPRKKGKK